MFNALGTLKKSETNRSILTYKQWMKILLLCEDSTDYLVRIEDCVMNVLLKGCGILSARSQSHQEINSHFKENNLSSAEDRLWIDFKFFKYIFKRGFASFKLI